MSALNSPLARALTNIYCQGLGSAWKNSLAFTKFLTLVAVSTITYSKNLFARENFKEANYSTLLLKILRKECEDQKAQLFLDAIHEAFDALDKKYLHQLVVGFYGEDGNREYLMEYYAFEFRYISDSSPLQTTTGEITDVTEQCIQHQMIDMLKNLLPLAYGRKPTNIGIKLFFNDDTPDLYQVAGFRRYPQDDGWAERESTLKKTLQVGLVETYYHKLIVRHYKMEEANVSRPADAVATSSTVEPLATDTRNVSRPADAVATSSTMQRALNDVCAPLATSTRIVSRPADAVATSSNEDIDDDDCVIVATSPRNVSRPADAVATCSTMQRALNDVCAPLATSTRIVSKPADAVATPSTMERKNDVCAPLATCTRIVSRPADAVATSSNEDIDDDDCVIVATSPRNVSRPADAVATCSTMQRALNDVCAPLATSTRIVSKPADAVATPSTMERKNDVCAPLATCTRIVSRPADAVATSSNEDIDDDDCVIVATSPRNLPSPITVSDDLESTDFSFEENSSRRSSSELYLSCPCNKPEEIEDPISTKLLICNYCGTIQHAACFGLLAPDVTDEILIAHACDMCSETYGIPPTDPSFDPLSFKERECLATYRRVLEWLFDLESVSGTQICERFGLPVKCALKAMNILDYYKIIRFDDADWSWTVKTINRTALHRGAEKVFTSVHEDDVSIILELPRVVLQNSNNTVQDELVPRTTDEYGTKRKSEGEEPPRKFFKTKRPRKL